MRLISLIWSGAIFGGVWISHAPAWAQDSCSDVLVNGTFASEKFKSSEYYKHYVYSSFINSDFKSSGQKTIGGATIPVGKAIIGADYTQDQFDNKKSSLSKTLTSDLQVKSEKDIALYFGDETVIDAWSQCMMNHRAGLSLRFKQYPGSPNIAKLYLEWFPALGLSDTSLKSDIVLPEGVTATPETQHCLKAGNIIRAQVGCEVQLNFDRSDRIALITATPTIGASAEAFLPARMKLSVDFDPRNILGTMVNRTLPPKADREISGSYNLPKEKFDDDWAIDPRTVRLILDTTHGGNVGGRCRRLKIYKTAYVISWRFFAEASRRASVRCQLNGQAQLRRERFVPM